MFIYGSDDDVIVRSVCDMKELSKQELKAIHLELAIHICTKFPSLYNKIYGRSKAVISDYESAAAEILGSLCELEPSIGHILKFYYKREQW